MYILKIKNKNKNIILEVTSDVKILHHGNYLWTSYTKQSKTIWGHFAKLHLKGQYQSWKEQVYHHSLSIFPACKQRRSCLTSDKINSSQKSLFLCNNANHCDSQQLDWLIYTRERAAQDALAPSPFKGQSLICSLHIAFCSCIWSD